MSTDAPLIPVAGVSDQSADATTSVVRNQQVGKLVDALSASGTDVVAAIDAITAAVVASIIGGTTGTTDNRLLRAKGTGGRALENCLVACDDSGNLTGANSITLAANTAYALLCGGTTTSNPIQSIASVGTLGQLLNSNGAGALPTFKTDLDQFASVIPAPTNQTYLIGIRMAWSGVIQTLTTKSTAGTCTMTASIDGVAVTGISNAVSTSEVTSTATAANSYSAGQDIALIVTSNSGCLNLSFNLVITKVAP